MEQTRELKALGTDLCLPYAIYRNLSQARLGISKYGKNTHDVPGLPTTGGTVRVSNLGQRRNAEGGT